MSDNLVDANFGDKSHVTAGETITAAITYETDFGATVHIAASNGFDVEPQSHYLPMSATRADVDLVITPAQPLQASARCVVTFTFVVNFQRAEVWVDPLASGTGA